MARLGEFFLTEYNRLIRFVRRRIDDAADRDAEDIVQDVMLNLFEKADIADPIENLSAYIYQALRNRITDMFRKRKKITSLRELVQPSSDDPESAFQRKELTGKICDAIDKLDDDQRAIVIATELENRSFREISEEWRVPIGTLLARKSRAVQKIKQELTGLV